MEKNNKQTMKKTILSLASIMILFLFLGIVSASLSQSFEAFEATKCNVQNSDGVNIPSAFSSKFLGTANCTIVLDYLPLNTTTTSLIENESFYYTGVYLDYYVQIERRGDNLFLFSKDLAAMNSLVNIVKDYEDYSELFAYDNLIIFKETNLTNYADAISGSGNIFGYYGVDSCIDQAPVTIFEPNFGDYVSEGNSISFSSACVNNMSLRSYTCHNETIFHEITVGCECDEGKCIANSRSVLSFIMGFDGIEITEEMLYSVTKSWIDN